MELKGETSSFSERRWGIRTLYSRIRKVIGREKHGAKVLDRIDGESRKVNGVLHKAVRKILWVGLKS